LLFTFCILHSKIKDSALDEILISTLEKLLLRTSRNRKVFILVDHNTEKFCLSRFANSIQSPPFHIFSLPPGETEKNLNRLQDIYNALVDFNLNRNDLIINLGGGVVGDIGAFAASTFKRGIEFWNIPTTLLAMVDAAHGGKNGVNFRNLKNFIGTFNAASHTYICQEFLSSLPKRELFSGKAEMIKHCLISDGLNQLEWFRTSELEELPSIEMILHSAQIKLNIVNEDPKEQGLRKILNYGHTIGHAIENVFAFQERDIRHGEAIACGMECANRISEKLVGLDSKATSSINNLLRKYFPPIPMSPYEINLIAESCGFDKKNDHFGIQMVLLERIGSPIYNQLVSREDVLEALELYTQS